MYITENPDVPCKQRDPELWFARADSQRTKTAKALCHLCPERKECLASTMRFELREGHTQPGVFGGLNEPERVVLRHRMEQRTQAAVSA